MRRTILLLGGLLLGCGGGTVEDACRDACDHAESCYSGPGTVLIERCHNDCAENERLFENLRNNGLATNACYDAVRDSFDCAADVACDSVVYDDLQEACPTALRKAERACGG